MKLVTLLALAAICTACSSTGNVAKEAGNTDQIKEIAASKQATKTLPTEEKAFVKAIEELDRKSIIEQLGEPAKADDVRIKGSNKVVASIWHYHNINTDENGKYFETTELDLIDDKVVQVVFLNNDGSEEAKKDGLSYEIPENKQGK